ncbi:MAG: LamG-like jellyroll fold domain-containing protein, partial [Verrucomicrobiota bacterium]
MSFFLRLLLYSWFSLSLLTATHGQSLGESARIAWDASEDTPGDGVWESVIAEGDWSFRENTSPTIGLSNLPGIFAWYESPIATMVSVDSYIGNDGTQLDASWELIFRPGPFEGNRLLFETGGNIDGTSAVIQGDLLEFRVQDANSDDQRVILTHTLTGDNDFHHMVVTVQPGPAGENEFILFVNGARVDAGSATGDLIDWAGNNGAGMGQVNSDHPTGQTGLDDFTGAIAALRLYDRLLTPAEIAAEYDRLQSVESDSDNDGLSDSLEIAFFGNLEPSPDDDPDGDGLTNLTEQERGTNPALADTDSDGWPDGVETGTGTFVSLTDTGTDPTVPDTDGDRLLDGVETRTGTFVNATDTGTDPFNFDSDNDGFTDSFEVEKGSDPTNGDSIPDDELGEPTETLRRVGPLATYQGRNSGDANWEFLDVTFLVNIDFEEKTEGNREVIWESGAGTVGLSMVYETGNQLVLRKSGNGGLDVATVEYELPASDLDGGPLLLGWTFDQENDNQEQVLSLIVGDRIVASQAGNFQADWTGSDPAAFGVANGSLAAGGNNTALTGADFISGTIDLDQGLRLYVDRLFVPTTNDNDGDGLPDSWEIGVGLDPATADADDDPDGDSLSNADEFAAGTHPKEADTDKDGLTDAEELDGNPKTDPLIADIDQDGLPDGAEIANGTNPFARDTDADTAPDAWEIEVGSNPLDPLSPGLVVLTDLEDPTVVLTELATGPSLNNTEGGFDLLDVTFRLYVDLNEKLEGTREVLFETGAGTIGFSLSYEAENTLVLRAAGNGGFVLAVASYQIPDFLLDEGELELMWTYDVANDDETQTIALWINSIPVSSAMADLGGDWSGSDGASFGVASTNMAGTGSNGGLTGADFTSGTINLATGLEIFGD